MKNDILKDFSTRGAVNNINLELNDYNKAVETVAKWYSMPYINLMYAAGINDLNYDEYLCMQTYEGNAYNHYLHLSDYGEERIGNILAGYINTLI